MIKKIIRIAGQFPLYLFLLPIFFVLHNYMQYYGLVSVSTALAVLAKIEIVFVVFLAGLFFFTKKFNRCAQITALTGSVVLFYGVIKDFFKNTVHISFLAKYSVLLPVAILLILLAIKAISKKNDFTGSNRFFNTLLLLFIVTDGILLLYSGAAQHMQRNQLVKNNILNIKKLPVARVKPDVYFLVFDSYPGTVFLRSYLQYDNALDSILESKGFYVTGHPKSNYNRTAFSMAATLNFEYLQNIQNQSRPEPKHYNQASLSIERSVVPAVFINNGYSIYNLSFFDLQQHPALEKENFLVLSEEKMLLYNSLQERFRYDVLWNFPLLKFGHLHITEEQQKQAGNLFNEESSKKKEFNNKAIDSVQKIPLQDTAKPKFVYAHFYLPHPPFFYDRDGKPVNVNLENVEWTMEDKASFISYLEYTNKVILKIVDTLLRRSHRLPVIIIQSDHGYRDFRQGFVPASQYFKNYAAFYFPDKNYSSLYDTISNINTFPVIFNKYFKTSIPLQKDSSVFMEY